MSDRHGPSGSYRIPGGEHKAGFTLVEAALASLVLLVICGAVFTMLARTQQDAADQTDNQAVVESARHGLETVCRYLRQAGNDPLGIGLVGIEISGPGEVRLRSDLTGSSGAASPDKGDPDGDTLDSGEDVTIRYNPGTRAIEVRAGDGAAQALVNNITEFSLQYYDGSGGATGIGSKVRKVRVELTATRPVKSLRTRRFFSISLGSDVQLAARQ